MKKILTTILAVCSLTIIAVAQNTEKKDKNTQRETVKKERAKVRTQAKEEQQGAATTDTTEFVFTIQRVMPSYDRLTVACEIKVSRKEVNCYLPVAGKNTNLLTFFSTDFSYEKRVNKSGTTISLKLNKTLPDNMPCRIDFDIPKKGEASAYVRMLTLEGGSYTFMGIVKPLKEGDASFVGAGGYSISF